MNVKQILIALSITVSVNGLYAQGKKPVKAGPKKPLPTQAKSTVIVPNKALDSNDSLSYAIGVNIGQSFKQQGLDGINLDMMKAALADVLANKPTRISAEECMPVIMNTMKKMQEKKFAPLKADGEKYLAENAKKAGVTITASGLQYEIIKNGDGAIPKASDRVNVHYHGTTIDSKVFDSSVDRGQPATFGVTQVIQGWVEALQLMPVGSKWKLTIPQALAYGERGAGENIPPFSTLIFEVELLSIESAEPAAVPPTEAPKN
jgi:FKBP-type peptidyl-prolyl cis-trans isomerase FklB